ncbi:MotE family protein [Sphingomonas sp. Leaf231]|uniref:MotE family protein n=1 Tax=Sphingomonas sp. Leaf231 TaxID=1736301 RepID=UPI0012E1176D|nr:hypothetical protein [Sphingomonas sp. Leaf231]
MLLATTVLAGAAAVGQAVDLARPDPKQGQPGAAIAQGVADRDRVLARRSRAMDLREQSIKAAERRLAAAQATPDVAELPTAGREPADASIPASTPPIDELARIYQSMKPAKAAAIMGALDLETRTLVARKMRNRTMGGIMTYMEPQAAARLSMRLAGRTTNSLDEASPTTSAPPRPPVRQRPLD